MKHEEVPKYVELPLSEITPYEGNARRHTQEDIDVIAQSITDLGFADPIGVWGEKNIIVEGHGRYYAAKKLGIKKVPCIRLDYMTDEERKKYGLAHNFTAEQSEWDMPKYELELINLSELGVDLSLFMKDHEEENQGEKSKEKVYESMELKAFEHHDYHLSIMII